jgi:hypothetical protein
MREPEQRLGYWPDGERVRVRFPVWTRDFSLLHNIQTGSEAQSGSYTMGTRGCKIISGLN